ncbi:MAG: UDP-N-acetylglucosamine 2-epimerase (non-hydrolyzing) [Verrucomicrobiota bacterium]|nr:UDP-N-acetylglucosamine 2-epimerase (non-hydrolyzing) [Verrucomicrobiota bacterium]
MKVMAVVGARPNFMKIAPFVRELRRHPLCFDPLLVHTGQHYDETMSASFFPALRIPEPDAHLAVGSGTHAEQVGRTMIAFEQALKTRNPDLVVVAGDVNATCACSVTAAKERVKVAHIEAGLRSFDRSMPEEINRIVTDRLSDILFTPDEIADRNLLNEGIDRAKVKLVGNIMIDTLDTHREAASRLNLGEIVTANRMGGDGLASGASLWDDGYALLTLHRPSNVDDPDILARLIGFFADEVAHELPLVWTVHPRSRRRLEADGLWQRLTGCPGIILLEPVGYIEMLRLNLGARIMFTDSGGLQEECCVLGTPCVTLRNNTERPLTLREYGGTCELAGNDLVRLRKRFLEMRSLPRRPFRPPMWDGRTAERIVASMM